MIVIKSAGKILGAKLSNAQQKALNIEISRQAAEFERKVEIELEAMVLYTLYAEYGWREQRLRKFWDAFRKAHRDLIHRYEVYESAHEDAWICQHLLKEAGIDIEEWDRNFDVENYVSENDQKGQK